MNKKFKRLSCGMAFCLALLFLCESVSFEADAVEWFKGYQKIPKGKAVVYLYLLAGMGFSIPYCVWLDGEDEGLVCLPNLGYYPYVTDPGKVTFKLQTGRVYQVTLDIKADEYYFIHGAMRDKIFYFEQVPQKTADKEIIGCFVVEPSDYQL